MATAAEMVQNEDIMATAARILDGEGTLLVLRDAGGAGIFVARRDGHEIRRAAPEARDQAAGTLLRVPRPD